MESKTPIPRMTSASQSASEMLGSPPRPTRMLAALEGVSSQRKQTRNSSHRSKKAIWVPLLVVAAAVGIGWTAWSSNEARIAQAERGNPVQSENTLVVEEVRGAQKASVVQLAVDDATSKTTASASKSKQTASNARPKSNATPAATPVKVAANSSITTLAEAAPPTRRRTSATDPIPEPVQFASVDLEKNPGPKVEFIDPEEAVAAGKQAARTKPAREPDGHPPVVVASTRASAADALPRVTPRPAAAPTRATPARAAQQEVDVDTMMLAGLLGTLEEKPQDSAATKEQSKKVAQASAKSRVPRTVRLERCNRMFVGQERANCRQAVCGGLWGEVPECPADRRFF